MSERGREGGMKCSLLLFYAVRSAKSVKEKERKMLIQQLRIEAAGLCPVLSQTVPYGVAYHHSGNGNYCFIFTFFPQV